MGQPTVLEAYKAERLLLIAKIVGVVVVVGVLLVFFLLIPAPAQALILEGLFGAVLFVGGAGAVIVGIPAIFGIIGDAREVKRAAREYGVREDD